MHQADGLEEAAVLHCGHLRQVGCQKRPRKSPCMAERRPQHPQTQNHQNWGGGPAGRSAGAQRQRGRRSECWAFLPPLMAGNIRLGTRTSKLGGDPVTGSLDAGGSLKMMEKGPERDRPVGKSLPRAVKPPESWAPRGKEHPDHGAPPTPPPGVLGPGSDPPPASRRRPLPASTFWTRS